MDAHVYKSIKPLDSVVHFLKEILKDLGWYKQKEGLVLDVGCGPGHLTLKYIFPLFPDVEKFVGLDCSSSMIETAKTHNFHPKIEYYLYDFEDKCDLKFFNGQVTKLISIHCFNWFKNQEKCFQRVYDLLQPNGEAALYFVLSSDFYAAVVDIYKDLKWKKYFEGVDNGVPESHYMKYDATHYVKIVEDIGFNVVFCQNEQKVNLLKSEQDAKDRCYSLSVLRHHVPENLREEFKNDLYKYVLDNGGINKDGNFVHRAVTLELVVKKITKC